MNGTLELAQDWIARFGYFSPIPALYLDATGVPWPWVMICLLAGSAGLNVPLLIFLGFITLSVWDHACYLIGAAGGRKALRRVEERWPSIGEAAHGATRAVEQRGLLAVAFGRFLPVVGRFVGLGAGLAGMSYARFAFFDAIGVGIVSVGFGVAAHLLGRQVVDDPRFAIALNVMIFLGVAGLLISAVRMGLQKMHARDAHRRAELATSKHYESGS